MDIFTACLLIKFLGKLLGLSCKQPSHCITVLELNTGFFKNLLIWQYAFSKQDGIFSVCFIGSSPFFMLTLCCGCVCIVFTFLLLVVISFLLKIANIFNPVALIFHPQFSTCLLYTSPSPR